MQSKNNVVQQISALALIAAIVCALMFWNFLTRNSNSRADPFHQSIGTTDMEGQGGSTVLAALAATFYEPEARSGLPVRLKIPTIGVDATIEYVGLAADGAMDIPKGPAHAAWFDIGPRPGERGSAVISGHYGWKNNIPAIFDDLHMLHEGDKVYVVDEHAVTHVFIVRGSKIFDPHADTIQIFGSNDGKSHLNLITCDGTWSETRKSYSNRLVVFTDEE